ncbi:hypothetical protein SISSUDRAFT_1044546 [Sistotremastrum suecicum HHB10207 ss-3]|uniref:Secreted protein n=1 Tax=Sistotremastrum suecicum HHB10207 ss-3 TaxID=1314776 RepID=A0A166F027_9AGAM|nr:hypothetical protein SISSUDRAFT_1044546 [Sistotremastrum suecicum HHB10207 ss-3]
MCGSAWAPTVMVPVWLHPGVFAGNLVSFRDSGSAIDCSDLTSLRSSQFLSLISSLGPCAEDGIILSLSKL